MAVIQHEGLLGIKHSLDEVLVGVRLENIEKFVQIHGGFFGPPGIGFPDNRREPSARVVKRLRRVFRLAFPRGGQKSVRQIRSLSPGGAQFLQKLPVSDEILRYRSRIEQGYGGLASDRVRRCGVSKQRSEHALRRERIDNRGLFLWDCRRRRLDDRRECLGKERFKRKRVGPQRRFGILENAGYLQLRPFGVESREDSPRIPSDNRIVAKRVPDQPFVSSHSNPSRQYPVTMYPLSSSSRIT